MSLKPIYTPENCKVAYQLNWSYTVFWIHDPLPPTWLDELRAATEPDGIRILQHSYGENRASQFLISTRPDVPPVTLVARVKGRLQHLIRGQEPKAFQRNYNLRSIGSTKRDKLEAYLASQPERHRMADARVQERFERHQIHNRDLDLSQPRFNAHARYWYNLHIVLVNDHRSTEVREGRMESIQTMILRSTKSKGHLLSRAAILADHQHLSLGAKLDEAPQDVALSYMNNLAYACEMKPVFEFSFFVGTFGECDLGVIPRE